MDSALFGDTQFHETLAQLITWQIVKHDENLKTAFETLNEHQSGEYKLYKNQIHKHQEEIEELLIEANENHRPKTYEEFWA